MARQDMAASEIEEIASTGPKASVGTAKMATGIPPDIMTPDLIETHIGTLEFFDGFPTSATVQNVYDNLDFLRGAEAFLTAGSARKRLRS